MPGSRSQSAADGRGSANGGSRGSGGAGMGADYKQPSNYESYAPAYAEYSNRDAKGSAGSAGGNYMSFENEYD